MHTTWKILLSSPILYSISLLIMAGMFVVKFNTLPPQIPLYYSRPGSDSQIVQLYYIFLIPLIALIFITINSFFASKILKDEFAKSISWYLNVCIIIIMLYIFVRIMTLIS